ncbi:MAG: acetylxylan esterase [Acidobacteria bacterium]|nr:acetylxylan esterase [Acidobacteriota bacterium]
MATRISRRQLGMAALAASRLAEGRQSEQPSGYKSALDAFESKIDRKQFDPIAWTQTRYRQAPLRMTFNARSRKQADAWQKQLRAKVSELLGGFPRERGPVNPIALDVHDFPKYRRDTFIFESRPGSMVLAYLLTPKQGKAPFPAMVCVPGHGRGVDDIVGIDDHGNARTNKDGYQHDFAIQAVEHGMAVVAIEPMAFGCRRNAATIAKGLGNSVCQPTAGAALLLGETMIGWRVFDVMRTIDWIETRKDLDAARVGCMGISGGGTCTTYAAATEPRIKVAFISGYLNTFYDSIFSLSHCIDNYVPGILNWAEMYDVAGLIAPRPLFVESGEKDNIFPIAASLASFERVKKVYGVYDSAHLCEQETFDAPHTFWGRRGLPFCAKHLGVA